MRSSGPKRGETLSDFYQRATRAAQRLALEFAGRAVVWVTHGGVLDCLHRAAMRVTLDASRTWTLDNASINRLLHTDQGLMLVGWGDIRHLDADSDRCAKPAKPERDKRSQRPGRAATRFSALSPEPRERGWSGANFFRFSHP